MPHKHTRYVATIRCPQCGLGMWLQNATDTETVYICINNHIHKIPRTGPYRPARNNTQPPDAA